MKAYYPTLSPGDGPWVFVPSPNNGGSNLWIEPPGKASLSTCVHGTEASGVGANSVLLLLRTGEISPACLRTKQRLAAVAQVLVLVSSVKLFVVC